MERTSASVRQIVRKVVQRSRRAQAEYATYDQLGVDAVVTGVAWAVYSHAEELARVEAAESEMGNVADKTYKNKYRILGTIAQMQGERTVGIIEDDPSRGIIKIAKPKGVFASFVPRTNCATGSGQNAMIVLKGRNSIIFCPHPRTVQTTLDTTRLIRSELDQLGAPADLVLTLDTPTPELRSELMAAADAVLATGGAGLVRAAYSSGTPALGVGPGNAVTVVDGTSDVDDAVRKIVEGKTFDYATSCSAENSAVIASNVYAQVMSKLREMRGYLLTPDEKKRLEEALWREGRLNDALIGKAAPVIAERAGLTSEGARRALFFLVEETGIGPEFPFSGEKLAVVLTVYRYDRFEEAIRLVNAITSYQGRGHSCGIHSTDEEHILRLAEAVKVCRVLVRQNQSLGNSGNFDNSLPFTSALGCGSWGRNSEHENITWRHCINVTHLVRSIPMAMPSEDQIFGSYRQKVGRRTDHR